MLKTIGEIEIKHDDTYCQSGDTGLNGNQHQPIESDENVERRWSFKDIGTKSENGRYAPLQVISMHLIRYMDTYF